MDERQPQLIAAPNRVVLRFPPVVEKKGSIHVPETSQLRPEFGEIVSIGEPVGDEATAYARFFEVIRKSGQRVPVSVVAGVRYWRESYESEQWLADLRVYRITELAAALVGHPDYPPVEGA
jgi:hypothetical protein